MHGFLAYLQTRAEIEQVLAGFDSDRENIKDRSVHPAEMRG